MLILAFTAIAILAWLGAAVFANSRRSEQPGARAEPVDTGSIPTSSLDAQIDPVSIDTGSMDTGSSDAGSMDTGSMDAGSNGSLADDERFSGVADEARQWLEQQNDSA